MSLFLLAVGVAPAAGAPLPLRSDEVLSVALLFRVAIFTGLLLLGAYVVLRLYSRLGGAARTPDAARALTCESALRLSARTKVYLLRAGDSAILITESTAGSQATVLPPPAATPTPAPAPAAMPAPARPDTRGEPS